MKIHKAARDAEHPFAMVSKSWINDCNISFKAKGIMVYLISKPDFWKIRECDLVNMSTEGRAAIRSALLELETAGYLNIVNLRQNDGRFGPNDYELWEEPHRVRFSASDNRTDSNNEVSNIKV